MSDKLTDQELDDRLAEFTDALLVAGDAGTAPPLADEAELRLLERVVIRLKGAIADSQPDQAMARRILTRLVPLWRQSSLPPKPGSAKGAGWVESLRRLSLRKMVVNRPRTFALGLAVIVVVALVAAWLLIPAAGIPLVGAAGTQPGWLPLIIFLFVVAGIVLVWLARFRR